MDTLVRGIDVAPTLLDCVGLPIPRHMQGRSMRPLMESSSPAPNRTLLAQWHEVGATSLRAGHWKLIRMGRGGAALYDVASDPAEQRDVAREHPNVRADLERRLNASLQAADARAQEFAAGSAQTPDEETRKALKALGYLEGGGN